MEVRKTILIALAVLITGSSFCQELSEYITIDQFGYLPVSRKVAVIRDPQQGFDAGESFSPGAYYAVVNSTTGEKVYRGERIAWGSGKTDPSSGDRAWHFDFTAVEVPGTYFVLDEERNVRSHKFIIAHHVYNEVLRQAMRTFFYQRAGFPKEAQYAGEGWADGASHMGPLQDTQCRSFFDKDNPETEKDVHGGWYDAGDYNKYSSWTANYIVELMKAYSENPGAWGDDYNIPESGNGIPDILDEARWGIDHLMRMREEDGSVLSIVGEAHGSPPSSATGPSYYGPPNTSATLNTSAAFALAAGVYRTTGDEMYADTLLAGALRAWDWAELYPDSLFDNNHPEYNSEGLGAGRQEVDDYGRFMARLEAACYLFQQTGDHRFRDFFDSHYEQAHLFQWNFAYPFEGINQEVMLHYTTLPGGTPSVQDHIRNVYRDAVVNGEDNLAAYVNVKDPYLAHTATYTWGSNGVKSSQGSMNYNLITYGLDEGIRSLAEEAAEAYLHNLHGVNPLNFVYLSNMYGHGAENGVNEFYHSWFTDGSPLWDRVGVSLYGPPPGYLTGGSNPQYDWDGCCPSDCGSSANNALCYSEPITPPKGQPPQKSYKDFNTSWPLNSWSVTENSCGYQVRYIRLLSRFVTAGMDCNGEVNGGAFIDSCGVCAGGSTGIVPSLDPGSCQGSQPHPKGDTMYVEGRHLYTPEGEKIILRGVNEMFVWSDDLDGSRLLPEIAKTGANAVRLVWTAEEGNEDTLVELIGRCIAHQMIAMPECHSATGDWSKLDVCVSFWKHPALIEGIGRNRQWTLLNIGNEVGDGNVTAEQFKTGYMNAIDSLRGWGYTVPLVIDASRWGQDVDVILATWREILEHDPLHNILFSVHSYWSGTENYQRVATESVNGGLPVIIGEGPSPTKYPECTILDYATGLEVTGQNEIGWLSWSWGGVPNGHCVPNFDHTYNGEFGKWRTSYAADMMAEHPFSLMRTAERPPSFYSGDTVAVSGIYLSPDIDRMTAGDSVLTEVLVAPANAADRRYSFEVSGDTVAVRFDPATGKLEALESGTVRMKVFSSADPTVTFTREITITEIPVSAITITPSEAEMQAGDTLLFSVEVTPENATEKDYRFAVSDTSSVICFDSALNRVIALNPGSAEVTARWVKGNVSGTLEITVLKETLVETDANRMGITVYPNPAREFIQVICDSDRTAGLKMYGPGGRLIRETRFSGSICLKTKQIPAGSYLLVIRVADRIVRRNLIIM